MNGGHRGAHSLGSAVALHDGGMFDQARQLATFQTSAKALGPRPVSLEAILVLGAFVVAGLIWLAVGAAVMRSGPKPGVRPVHQVLPRAAAGEDLEHLL